ncbi:MAG TPA: EamA family transporter [Candidatus Methylomirabilis sp.]|nr:EamA family transporter [Candidatus Methylomirabilis sp.]
MALAWIPITLTAAAAQAVRTALQRYLKGRLSTNGAAFTRFVFGVPLASVYLAILISSGAGPLPAPRPRFWMWVMVAAVSQIVATSLQLYVMAARNFATGVAYAKTEVVQAALFEIVFLGAAVTWLGGAGIALGTVAVMLMSLVRTKRPLEAFLSGWSEPTALVGLAAGGLFGLAAVGFRGASVSLGHPSAFVAAAFTLVVATVTQTLIMGVYLALRERGELGRVLVHAPTGALVGVASFVGSAGWFTAFTMQVAAYVRTLGLVELGFTLLISLYAFRERPGPAEMIGLALLVVSIAMVLNSGH